MILLLFLFSVSERNPVMLEWSQKPANVDDNKKKQAENNIITNLLDCISIGEKS